MVDRAFLKPRSVERPAQGDFQYTPVIRVHEADTAAGLQAMMNSDFSIDQQSVTDYYVVEDIRYQTSVVRLHPNIEMRYSALVWLTKVSIV